MTAATEATAEAADENAEAAEAAEADGMPPAVLRVYSFLGWVCKGNQKESRIHF